MTLAETARWVVALGALAVLLWWTVGRLRGENADPVIRYSSSSRAGSTSALVSGVHAVGFVAIIALVALGPEVMAVPGIALAIAALVVVHLFMEWREAR